MPLFQGPPPKVPLTKAQLHDRYVANENKKVAIRNEDLVAGLRRTIAGLTAENARLLEALRLVQDQAEHVVPIPAAAVEPTAPPSAAAAAGPGT